MNSNNNNNLQTTTANKKTATSVLLYFLKMFVSPVNGWKSVKSAALRSEDVAARLFYPSLGLISVGLIIALLMMKPLDALLLGDRYAQNLGVNTGHTRHWLLLCTGLLSAVSTAFCGPITFIGLATPHMARFVSPSGSHRSLLPITMLMGSSIALVCNLVCNLPNHSVLPINVLTPLIGAPVIIYHTLSPHLTWRGRKKNV